MKILHLVLYEKLYPPKNGGMLRCWNLASQLSLYFDVDLLTLQPDIEKSVKETCSYSQGRCLNFISPSRKNDLNNYKGLKRIITAIKFRLYYKRFTSTNLAMLDLIPVWKKIKDRDYDTIVFEHLESLFLLPKLKTLFPRAKYILDAHNVDHILSADSLNSKNFFRLKKMESNLYKSCDLVLSCSTNDAHVFNRLNQGKLKVLVVPNGVDVNQNYYKVKDLRPGIFTLLFCGTLDYAPNNEGIIWFINKVWPLAIKKFPLIILKIIGAGQPSEELLNVVAGNPSIDFIGTVEDVKGFYRDADVAIVPLLQGSGTRLKILEAMSLGVPVISTSTGAEGIDYTDDRNIWIADTVDEFIEKIQNYIASPETGKSISKKARDLVEKNYSWQVVGKNLSKGLKNINTSA